ncbi:hypothetical protein N7475_001361 [Penicillium sp. IBT 31633x]|nr:hypothetical protein N7475_001361 [Penicillium sp. IBT 31633x]
MDRELKASTLEKFKKERNGFVEELQALANGHTGGKAIDQIKSDLLCIRDKIFIWSLITANSMQSKHRCFKPKCLSLGAILKRFDERPIFSEGALDVTAMKIFKMLAIQMARLTPQGYIAADTEAERSTRIAEQEQLEWQRKPRENDDAESAVLRVNWTFMHVVVKECTCTQCWELDSTPCPSPTAGMS